MSDVVTLNGYKIKDEKAVRSYESIAQMKADTKLKEGYHVKTKGYYEANDGGHGDYIIVDDETLVDDGGSIHVLTNGLRAKLVDNKIVNVKQFGTYGDNIHDDKVPIQNALNYSDNVVFNKGTYYISSSIQIANNKLIKGNDSIITTHSEMIAFTNKQEDIDSLIIDNMHFVGNCINDPDISHYPKRNRELKEESYGNGMTSAIILTGSNYKRRTYEYITKNITIKNCIFEDTYGLPIQINGCENVTFENNKVINCLDLGFVDCYNLSINNNYISKSADNGISISSGCENVTCIGNKVEYSAISGIWCAGWKTDGIMYYGPTKAIISDNIINYCRTGINCKWVVKDIEINNNIIDNVSLNYKGQTTDGDDGGIGINISGWSGTTLIDGVDTSVTEFSNNVIATNNIIKNTAKNGITVELIKNYELSNNTFENIGTKKHMNGDDVLSTERRYNTGIYGANYDISVVTNGKIYMNTFKDSRSDKNSFDYLNTKYAISQMSNLIIKDNKFFDYDSATIYIYGNIKDTIKIDDYLSFKETTGTLDFPDSVNSLSTLQSFINDNFETSYNKIYFAKFPSTLVNQLIGVSGNSGYGTIYRHSGTVIMINIFLAGASKMYTFRINNGSIEFLTEYTGTSI